MKEGKAGYRYDSGRHVMGRKGKGKVSLFFLANKIEVYTSKIGDNGTVDKNAFLMDYEESWKRLRIRLIIGMPFATIAC
jgi:hypothetical protein